MEKLREQLLSILPPLFSRKEASKSLGGLLSAKTLANLDSKGIGPKGRIQIAGKVAYTREAFIDWVIARTQKFENSGSSEAQENNHAHA
ncbi:hypothetical protein [Desulfocurvibacter africanus]|uniref:hypothetical protein n=1 Tax=Desulfocurvibacter africanus TaxID=873 RepID=UPI0005578695|nr:hypothetical protein [Desulfocurvibacter africanus]